MKRIAMMTATVLLASFWAAKADAQTPPATPSPCCGPVAGCATPKLCGCPDDYCRKPWPMAWCFKRLCGGDDYCRKPIPWLWRMHLCEGCDDYCRKPCPATCRPMDTS